MHNKYIPNKYKIFFQKHIKFLHGIAVLSWLRYAQNVLNNLFHIDVIERAVKFSAAKIKTTNRPEPSTNNRTKQQMFFIHAHLFAARDWQGAKRDVYLQF